MARGWESKSVESQIDALEERRASAERVHISEEQRRAAAERESLQLSVERVMREMNATSHPRRREQLAAGLAYLQEQLKKLE